MTLCIVDGRTKEYHTIRRTVDRKRASEIVWTATLEHESAWLYSASGVCIAACRVGELPSCAISGETK